MLSILNSHFIQYLQIILIVNILYRQLCYLRHLFIFYEHNLPQNITILIIIKIFKKKKKDHSTFRMYFSDAERIMAAITYCYLSNPHSSHLNRNIL